MMKTNFLADTLPVWLQIIFAIISIWLGWLVYKQTQLIDKQGQKIQDMSIVITELSKQNKSLESILNMVSVLTITDRMPFFTVRTVKRLPSLIVIQLTNIGQNVIGFTTEPDFDKNFKIQFNNSKDFDQEVMGHKIAKNRTAEFSVSFNTQEGYPVSFNIQFLNEAYVAATQTIFTGKQKDVTTSTPVYTQAIHW